MAAGMTWSGARLRPQSSPRKRVLVVDENPQDLRGCVDTLTRAGYHVSGCSSIEEGTRSLEAGVFGLIIVSQGTVAFEGRPLLERSIEMNRRVPVFVVTPSVDMACYLDAMQLGARDYIEKPVSGEQLLRIVANFCPPSATAA